MQVKRICRNCGREFNTRQDPSRGTKGQFCSKECYYQYIHEQTHVEKKCPECGKKFIIPQWLGKVGRRFCSQSCAAKYGTRMFPISHPTSKPDKRIRNRAERITEDGRRISLHRYLLENDLGRRLSSKEQVHHIDMNPEHNEIGNLRLYESASEHTKGHKSLEVLVKGLMEDGIVGFKGGRYFRQS